MSEEQDSWGGRSNETERRLFVEAPWVKIPLEMIRDREWSRSHIAVYGELYWRAGQRGYFYEFQARLGEQLGLSRDSVHVAITDLKEAGYIATEVIGPDYGGALRYVVTARIRQAPAIDSTEVSEELRGGVGKILQPSIRPEKPPEKPPESSTGAPPPTPPARQKKRATPISDAEYEKLHSEYDPLFGPDKVRDLIAEALNYYEPNAAKYASMYVCVRGSLRRAAERQAAAKGGGGNGTASTTGGSNAPTRRPSELEQYR